jgi:hypothetical protein
MTKKKTYTEPFSVVGGQFAITFLNSPYLWKMACEMRDEAAWVEKRPTGMSSRAVISVILSAATTEAFINELVAEVWKARHSLSPILVAFGKLMREIEDNRGSVGLKYLVASQALSGEMFDKGAPPFQDFDLLRRVRDSLVHIKSPDVLSEPSSSSAKRPEIIVALRQKRLTYPLGKDDQTPWFNELQTYKLAAWACETALNMILAVLALIPDGPADPSGQFKRVFRDGGVKKKAGRESNRPGKLTQASLGLITTSPRP